MVTTYQVADAETNDDSDWVRMLWAAVLKQAVFDYVSGDGKKDVGYLSAKHWFFIASDSESGDVGGFLWVADLLNLNPVKIRDQLTNNKDIVHLRLSSRSFLAKKERRDGRGQFSAASRPSDATVSNSTGDVHVCGSHRRPQSDFRFGKKTSEVHSRRIGKDGA